MSLNAVFSREDNQVSSYTEGITLQKKRVKFLTEKWYVWKERMGLNMAWLGE